MRTGSPLDFFRCGRPQRRQNRVARWERRWRRYSLWCSGQHVTALRIWRSAGILERQRTQYVFISILPVFARQ